MTFLGDSRKSAFVRILAFTGVLVVAAVSVPLGGGLDFKRIRQC